MMCPRTRMGEGFLSNKHPSPISRTWQHRAALSRKGRRHNIMVTAFAVVSHDFKQPISFPRRVFCAGVCSLLHSPRTRGARSAGLNAF